MIGRLEAEVTVPANGWIAARLSSTTRDSYMQPVFAHTSPVYVSVGAGGADQREAAAWFDEEIERSIEWVGSKGRFYTDSQRREVVDLFRQGQQQYRAMLK